MLNEQLKSYGSATSQKRTHIRFVVLLIIVLIAFGNEYAFNNPQALQQTLYERLHISETQFQLFYSLYSLPNIFTLIFIGYALDKFGMRRGLVLLAVAIALCQLLFAIGGQIQSYALMLFARVLYGIASRSFFIPQASMVAVWFRGRQLSFAMGIVITCPELGNALNSYLTPIIYEASDSLGAPLFTSVAICVLGVVGSIFVYRIDKQAEQIDARNDAQSEVSEYSLDTNQSKHEKIKLSDLKELSPTFWIVSILCTLTMSQYIPFLDNANRLFQKRFCFTQTSAGEVITVTYIATAVFSGPLGLLVNRVGYRRYFIIFTTIVFFTAHTILWTYPQCTSSPEYGSIWGLLLLGISFSFYANVIVAAIPLVVQRKVLGSAISIMEILSSLAECIVPMITGFLIGHGNTPQQGYKSSSLFFFLIGLTAIISSFSLFFIDSRYKKKLDKGQKKVPELTNLDDLEVPSEYKRISEELTKVSDDGSGRSSFMDVFKGRRSVGIELTTKLY